MKNKTIIIGAAILGGIAIIKKIKETNNLKKGLRNMFISDGLPERMAEDLARIGIRYRFNHKIRDNIIAEYVKEHFDEIPDDFIEDVPDNCVL